MQRNELLEAMDRAIDGCLERGCIRGDTLVECIEANGLAVVPVEPTEGMIVAGRDADNDASASPFWIPPEQTARMVYAAMLAASPLRGEG
jgi:hypothetical protein